MEWKRNNMDGNRKEKVFLKRRNKNFKQKLIEIENNLKGSYDLDLYNFYDKQSDIILVFDIFIQVPPSDKV